MRKKTDFFARACQTVALGVGITIFSGAATAASPGSGDALPSVQKIALKGFSEDKGIYLHEALNGQNTELRDNGYWVLAWHAKLADYGDSDSRFEVAKAYEKGLWTAVNLPKALHFYNAAAEQGHIGACMRLGKYWSDGVLIAPDRDKALYWYQRAAERGEAAAGFKLSELFETAVPPDYDKSYLWQQRALAMLFPGQKNLEAVSPRLEELGRKRDAARKAEAERAEERARIENAAEQAAQQDKTNRDAAQTTAIFPEALQ